MILGLHRQGLSPTAIARQLGIDVSDRSAPWQVWA